MELGDRMKGYEYVTRTYLPSRMPVIIRIDGRAFHSFTGGFGKPFDQVLSTAMAETTARLLANISGCVFGYTQSDEISLLLKNDQTNNTTPWFDNNISKLLSISASMATLYFNRIFSVLTEEELEGWNVDIKLANTYIKAVEKGAMFDSRAFVIPESEINNYFIWRQQDATRNSIQMVGQANFSHKELQYLKTNAIQDKLFTEKGINWNDFPTRYKRGVGVYKKEVEVISDGVSTKRSKPYIDYEIPIFTEDRDFITSKYATTKD